MTDPAHRSDLSLHEVLSRRARRTPASRLVIDIAGGIAVAVVAAWARREGWVVFVSAGLCLSSYGSWAATERRLFASPWKLSLFAERGWRAARAVAALLGIVSFLLLLLALLSVGLGRWSS